ncbi:MAG TPA: YciI family protein [Nocardioidaceae bacterium]|jgi:hypothetical protein|nr:YciI family protein [Nocardioidaceae bacterium]
MRFMVFVKMAEDVGNAPRELQEVMGRELMQAFADGSIVDAGGLWPTAQSTEIRLTAGEVTVSDGPYAEAKEVVGGYSILEARSQEEAVAGARRVAEIHQQYWPGWEGSVEVRRISGPEEGPPARD